MAHTQPWKSTVPSLPCHRAKPLPGEQQDTLKASGDSVALMCLKKLISVTQALFLPFQH